MEGEGERKVSRDGAGASPEESMPDGGGADGHVTPSTSRSSSCVEGLSGMLERCLVVTPTGSTSGGNGDEEGATGGRNQNPVGVIIDAMLQKQNQVVFGHFFKVCPPSLLAKFRLVSKQWHEVFLTSFRSSVWVEFNSSQCCFGYGFGRGKGKLEAFLQFVEDPRNMCDSKPFRRFRLVQWDFTDEECTHLIDRFWQACASSITHLKLEDCTYSGAEGFREIIYDACPNLQSLELRGYYNRTKNTDGEESGKEQQDLAHLEHRNLKTLIVYMSWEPLPVAWLEFLSHFTKLQTFMLSPKPEMTEREGDDVIVEMLRAVQVIRKKDKRKLTLTQLGILISSPSYMSYDRVSPALCGILRELQLPLESLAINFGKLTEPRIVKDILEVHAKTLKALFVQRDDAAPPYLGFPFGVLLNNLETLYLRNAKTFGENLNFLQATPNLRKLSILGYGPKLPRNCPNHFAPSPNCAPRAVFNLPMLTDLRINYALSSVSVEDVRFLVELMPNVEKLTMLLGDEQFGAVCGGWQNLVHLEVLGDVLTDEGVTGIKPEPGSQNGRLGGKSGAKAGPYRPNITWLKNLQSFEMSELGDRYCCPGLMDASAFQGFLTLDSLKSLKLTSRMSHAAREALTRKIPDCEIEDPEVDYDADRWFYADSILC